MPSLRGCAVLLLALCPCLASWSVIGNVTARPSAEQHLWMGYEVGAMITFNLQSACAACAANQTSRQECQAFGCLPTWASVQAWALSDLNVSQWLEAAASFGAKYAVLVVDHMSGFSLWPTRVHNVSVAATRWRQGRGDIAADFRAAASAAHIAPGIFYSTHYNWVLGVNDYEVGWPRVYGGVPLTEREYEDAVLAQLQELAAYGPWSELWFDGGVNTTATPRVGAMVRESFPAAICHSCGGFTETGPGSGTGVGVRWMGNEEGAMPLPSWGATDSIASPGGNAQGAIFAPPSCDTVLEEHYWFWESGDTSKLRSTCSLLNVYLTSVGRASNLILNLAPNPSGALAQVEMDAYAALGAAIQCIWSAPLASWANVALEPASGAAQLPLATPLVGTSTSVWTLTLSEDLTFGQRLGAWDVQASIAGTWQSVLRGNMTAEAATGVGHKRIVAVSLPAHLFTSATTAYNISALQFVARSVYAWEGDATVPHVLAGAALHDRGGIGHCLPASGCVLTDF